MKTPLAIVHLSVFMFVGESAYADDPTFAKWAELLRVAKDRIPQCSVEWNLERIIADNPEMVRAVSTKMDEEIAAAEKPTKKESLKKNKAAFIAANTGTKTIPISIKLDYVNDKQFYIEQVFKYPEGSIEYEYVADGDGVIYAANKTTRNVRLLRAESKVLHELARGLPEIELSSSLKGMSSVIRVAETPHSVVFDGRDGTSVVRSWLDKETLQLLKLQAGRLPATKDDRLGLAGLEREIVVSNITNESGYPVPGQVVVKSFFGGGHLHIQENWKLVRFQWQPDRSKMHSTKYHLKPGYVVTDETGPAIRKFISDHVLDSK